VALTCGSLQQAKGFTAGTHRARSPEETVRDYRRVMPLMGITRLANVTGLDRVGLPVWLATRPNSRGLSVSQGKGVTHEAAKASAMMESIEGWHAERIEQPLRLESVAAMRASGPVVDVTRLAQRPGTVLRRDQPILWMLGRDLPQDAPCWVPFETVTTNFVSPPTQLPTFFLSSNGLASGNHLLEAISHGLCEVIERDALTLWYLSGGFASKSRQLDLRTVGDAHCRLAIDALERADVEVAAWDITSDVGIAAYAAAIFERDDRPQWRAMGMFSGFGCHLAPEIALLRAVSEAYQSRLTMISGSRDDVGYRDYLACSNADDYAAFAATARTPAPALSFTARPSLAGDTFEADVDTLVEAVRRAGLPQVIVVDLTREEIGIPVVKVIVPGLETIVLASSYVAGARARRFLGVERT
jgi:ribosomal protein S12 methylthiotransferase accessory factor